MTTDDIFNRVTSDLTAAGLKDEASRLAFGLSSPLTLFQDERCGFAGQVVRRKIDAVVGRPLVLEDETLYALVRRILDHYNIPYNWIPPVALIHTSLALSVQTIRMLEPIAGRTDDQAGTIRAYMREVGNVATRFKTVKEVHKLPYEEVERLTREIMAAVQTEQIPSVETHAVHDVV